MKEKIKVSIPAIKKFGYISGMLALNLPCSLETCGDWHHSSYNWEGPLRHYYDTDIFGEYGIECVYIKEIEEYEFVANHIRALLDLISNNKFGAAQGMNNDFICNPVYDKEVFAQVLKLKESPNWREIYLFMLKEYGRKWKDFVKE